MAELRWLSVGLGLLATVAILAVAGAADAALVVEGPLLEFVAVLVGGFAAARLAGRVGVAHGLAVAVAFILGATAVQGWAEMSLASAQGPDAVAPLDLGSLILNDLVHLCAGLVGGWLARTGGLPARQP